jgi:hypothetical protein
MLISCDDDNQGAGIEYASGAASSVCRLSPVQTFVVFAPLDYRGERIKAMRGGESLVATCFFW